MCEHFKARLTASQLAFVDFGTVVTVNLKVLA